MEPRERRNAVILAVRIGLIFLSALAIVIFVAYYVLSQNFHALLTDYSIQLVQAMIGQGVTVVETELQANRERITALAQTFDAPDSESAQIVFQEPGYSKADLLRMVYISPARIAASDGQQREIRARQDIVDAFNGKAGIYGPYFDENGEYIISYTAPVIRNGEIAGALSMEKDGYLFCRLIKDIRFVNSGESYILNAEGTDIAVSDLNHIDWVNDQYNGRKLLEEQDDPTTRLIVELEQKGLDGETGVGTYMWNDGLVYVAYAPIPSVKWVLLAGMREEEIAQMTQSTMFSSVSKGPALKICLLVFLLLTGLIVVWIITSMKKSAEINENLKKIANYDSLTGLLNRRFLESELLERWQYPVKVSGQAAVFMADVDDFKKYNDFYGHPMGDECLRLVASVIKRAFSGCDSYVVRYGGEEFVAVVFLIDKDQAYAKGCELCRMMESENLENSTGGHVTISVGVCHTASTLETPIYECIKAADKALYTAKHNGKNRAVMHDVQAMPAQENVFLGF